MTLALAAATGFLAARMVWLVLRATFAAPVFLRENYRGLMVPTGAGIAIVIALLLVEAGRALASGDPVPDVRAAVLLAAAGFGAVGLLDDLAGDTRARGFRGHLGAMLRGRLTTGGTKLVGGSAVAYLAVTVAAPDGGTGRALLDAALVALAANTGNLLDRGPGRAGKAAMLGAVALFMATTAPTALTGVAIVAGAGAALLLDDLHERLMLGDAGANVIGGTLGLGVVIACAPATRSSVLLVLVAVNLVSEAVSLTRVIELIPPLRAFDRWGRR